MSAESSVTPEQEITVNLLPTEEIRTDPAQPRKFFDQEALAELTQSIKDHGVLQPILVRKDDSQAIILVAGERRLRAARDAGLKTIPAIFIKGNAAEVGLVENLLRENLTAIEEAEAIQKLIELHAYSREKLAQVLAKSASTISEILSLNRMPKDVRDECRSNPKCPRSVLVEVAKQKTENRMRALFQSYKKRGLTIQEVRKIARKKRSEEKISHRRFIKLLSSKLGSLPTDGWAEAEKQELREGLESLKKLIDDKIDVLAN